MAPSYQDLGLQPGDKTRLKPEALPPRANRREKYFVRQAPAHDQGLVILEGLLKGEKIVTTTSEDIFSEKTD